MDNYTTLVLNSAYQAHDQVPWRDAVTRMFAGSYEVLAEYDQVLTKIDANVLDGFPELKASLRQVIGADVGSIEIKIPAVVVIKRHVPMRRGAKYSRPNMYVRDRFTCQYCGGRFPVSKLNRDHVFPKAQWRETGRKGSPTTWENTVTSCVKCNSRKANRTPEQAGMSLLASPRKPKALPLRGPNPELDQAPPEWLPFLRGN